jgi:3-phenylpropionate/trans-cinnamate dioxygenase ferredoxin subunit
MTKWLDVGMTNEIADQGCKLIEIDQIPIAIFNLSGEFYAIKDDCPHQHLPLADGLVENCTITCPYHGACFNIKTGELLSPPACENLTTYKTRVVDDTIQIDLSGS